MTEAVKFLVEKSVAQGLIAGTAQQTWNSGQLIQPDLNLKLCCSTRSACTLLGIAGDGAGWEAPGGEVCGAGLGSCSHPWRSSQLSISFGPAACLQAAQVR